MSWAPIDRDMVLAYLDLERKTCNDCRTRRDEWGTWVETPQGRKFRQHREPPYRAKPTTCHGCETLERAWRKTMKGRDERPPGAGMTLVPDGPLL